MAIKNIEAEDFTVSDFAELTGLTREGLYYKIRKETLKKDLDYKLLSNNQPVFKITNNTILLVKEELREKLNFTQ